MKSVWMEPFWKAPVMYRESVLPVSRGGAIPEAKLLFLPEEILCVESARLDRMYQQGRDFILEGKTLRLTENSAIPFLTEADLYSREYIPGDTMPRTDGGGVLYREGSFFHDRQTVVTYRHKGELWTGEMPVSAEKQLPKTFAKLRGAEPLRLVLFGDSISEGANCSGRTGVPPYLPVWGQLIADELERVYGSQITFSNESVGGTTSQWGADHAHLVAEKKPDLLLLAFGMNDGSGTGKGDGVRPEIFGRNIFSIMEQVREINPDTEFILVSTTLPNPETIFFDRQAEYYAELERIANNTAGTAAANMTAVHAELLKHKSFLDMTGNNINHPNDFLNRCYAQFIMGMLK